MVTTYLVAYYGEDFAKPHKWYFSINVLAFYQEHFFAFMKLVSMKRIKFILKQLDYSLLISMRWVQ